MSQNFTFAMLLTAALATVHCSGSSSPTAATPTPTPAPVIPVPVVAVTISSITSSSMSVVGGHSLTAAVVLTGAAPAGGAVVALTGADPITVPASVTVLAGSSTAAFAVSTRAVSASISSTLSGSYGGASASIVLDVTRPTVATANFGVNGPTESETCTLINAGGTLNCTFNGSTSTAPGTIVAWDWTYKIATAFAQTTSSSTLSMPVVNCGFIPPPPMPAGNQWFTMTVTLVVHDSLGNVSPAFVNNDVRLFPVGTCGF